MRSGVTYSVRIKRSAAKALSRVPKQDRSRIVEAIDGLGEHPLAGSSLKGGLRGLRRVRVGDYRVVYEVLDDALVVLVVRVAHRGTVYRRS
ncbi:type II toxin-antitoxin system RelE family toxin [Candidatus Palauibacter sp.]|uniref:type II toxin-antitoxin system RelE family toxin n=1 Tax=Candidatus Palauibacter sp. TaxID=3101350 RepID=UPI003B5B9602